MPSTTPSLGLLLDVDGPIASPETRTIAHRSIVDDLITLSAAGVPIGFITGRSEAFMAERVVTPLIDAGLPREARVYGVCEKGGVWFEITHRGMGEVHVDRDVALPDPVVSAVRELVASEFSDAMFFDETKRAMISVEQRIDIDNATYAAAQERFDRVVARLVADHGIGIRLGDKEWPDARGDVPYRIDPTIISTDIESVSLDKATGATRCLARFAETGPLPRVWRSVGDSPGDYRMSDHLHEAGFDTAHVDVRPGEGNPDRPYPVITLEGAINDAAGAAFLRDCVKRLTRS